jgi:hypothetical protein
MMNEQPDYWTQFLKHEGWASTDEGWGQYGLPSRVLFGNAIQVWAMMQKGDVTVGQASKAFRCPPHRVIDAVDSHSWMSVMPRGDDPCDGLILMDGD